MLLRRIEGIPTAAVANLVQFRFDDRWMTMGFAYDIDMPMDEQWKWMYAFNAECRAYARLKEVNKEFVAIPCYGYLLLGEEQQAAFRKKDSLDWEEDWGCYGKHKGQPLRALVKQFIEYEHVSERDFNPGHNYRRTRMAFDSAATARKLIRNMKILHRAGILNSDINCMNVVQGRFLEFSSALTTPHPCLSTEHIEAHEHPYQLVGQWDASQVDDLIETWNQTNPMKKHIWDRAGPNWEYQEDKLRSHQHPEDWRGDPWNWNRGYRLRPDKFRWDKIGKTGKDGLGEAKQSKPQPKQDKKKSKRTKRSKSKLEPETTKEPAPTAKQKKHESKDKKESKRKKKTDAGLEQ